MSLKDFKHVRQRQMPRHPCPNCTRMLDGITGVASEVEDTIPTVGALTICAYCGVLLVIERWGFSFARAERLEEIDAEMRQAIAAAIRRPIGIGPSR